MAMAAVATRFQFHCCLRRAYNNKKKSLSSSLYVCDGAIKARYFDGASTTSSSGIHIKRTLTVDDLRNLKKHSPVPLRYAPTVVRARRRTGGEGGGRRITSFLLKGFSPSFLPMGISSCVLFDPFSI